MVMMPTKVIFDNCILFIISLGSNWLSSAASVLYLLMSFFHSIGVHPIKNRAVNMPILYGNVRSSNNIKTRKRMHLSIEPVIAYSRHVLYMWGLTSII